MNQKTKFEIKNFSKFYGDDIPFINRLVDEKNNSLAGKKVKIIANGITYERTTDVNGLFELKINWLPVKRVIKCIFEGDAKYEACESDISVNIKKIVTRMEGTEINKTFSQKLAYQCAVYDYKSRVAGEVEITVNGVTYRKTPDSKGLYKLNINLPPGTYKLTAKYFGSNTHESSSITNTINVTADPEQHVKCNSPWTQIPLLLAQKPGAMGQKTPYSCGPHSLMQAFYNLTGLDISENTIMAWAGTTTAGTSHAGLNTAVAQFNKKYGYNIKIKWKNMSDFGSSVEEQFREIGKLKCEGKFIFFHLLYRNKYGHYEVYKTNHGVNKRFDVANSLGTKSRGGYYGYIENRSYKTQKSYIGGISQPSVAILYR